MNNPTTMQSIINHHLTNYRDLKPLSPQQAKACQRIALCRTEAMGGDVVHCAQCDYEQTYYHSCRNRHCPQCQRQASQDWCERQCQQLLPVHYHHVIFTLPHTLNPWAQLHPAIIYQALFQAVWKTLKAFGQDPKRLGGQLGMVAVLHTWGQTLGQHIHLHCLIPSGAWNEETQSWHPAKSHYLFPVKALSKHFRGAMVSTLRQQYETGALSRIKRDFNMTLNQLMQCNWVVHSKPHLQNPETVVRYLARYTHKTAIDNTRITQLQNDHVTFRYKDYRDHDRHKQMCLPAVEFIRRFLLHILPDGFMRIRHYGYLANCCRRKKLDQIREALNQPAAGVNVDSIPKNKTHTSGIPINTNHPPGQCPQCQTGQLYIICSITPKRRQRSQ
ncbi:MAG: IS91 family transposase [Immundisolibacteraceae bacterium]|nr:IS91 family transposase [Immundisolibacteraceae bacterium]